VTQSKTLSIKKVAVDAVAPVAAKTACNAYDDGYVVAIADATTADIVVIDGSYWHVFLFVCLYVFLPK